MIGKTSAQMALRDPDIRLMLRVRDDDPAAFAELVELYQQRLIHVLHYLVGDAAEAEDLAQEVFLRVYQFRKKYHPRAKFSTWMYTIAHNLAHNFRQDRQRKPAVPLACLRDSGPFVGPRPAKQLAQDQANQPSGSLQQQELAAVVQQALAGLNERQRTAVVLNKFEDMSYAEIAQIMGLTTKAVKSLLSRARENLRLALEGYILDGRPAGGR
jgi:RNA polymerase sigma-70 factor (ECF subfamily)